MRKMTGYEAVQKIEMDYQGCIMDELERYENEYDEINKNAYYNKYIIKKIK